MQYVSVCFSAIRLKIRETLEKAPHNNIIMSRDFLTYSIVLLQFSLIVTQVVSKNNPLSAYIVTASAVFYLHKPS